ncbi:MAG: hypothetical protein IJ153_08970 [Clostridia bacterium]|nr:hypothetical protein [Clostridia bacterium]
MGGRLIKTDIDIAMENTSKAVREETEDRIWLRSIQSLVETKGFSIAEAMESLRIPVEKQATYARLLEQPNVKYNAEG